MKFTKAQVKAMPKARVSIGVVRIKLPAPGKLARWPQHVELHNTVIENGKKRGANWRKHVVNDPVPGLNFVRLRDHSKH
jgi:hypothetical protein